MKRVVMLSCAVLLAVACGKDKVAPTDAGPGLPGATCLDGDGDGVPGTGDCSGEPTVDCNDADPTVFPGAAEVCNGRDDNCNGQVDEGLAVASYYRDGDGDGYGTAKVGGGCGAPPAGTAARDGDCDDTNPTVHPGATEVCNGVDDDCNGQVDDGLTFHDYHTDQDGDGYGDARSAATHSCQASLPGQAPNDTDCNDADPTVHPGARELCNGVDDNCDGLIDNGIPFANYYPDADGDSFGSAAAPAQSACAPVAGKVTNNQDCDDTNRAVHPGAVEVCNGVDDNCDGQIDEGLVFANYYPDVDGDGYGAATGAAVTSCQPVAGKATNNGDCNDANPSIHPGAPEVCNGIDDNCNGLVDDGLTFSQYFADVDGDGYGAGTPQSACAPVAGRVTNATDCNDANPTIHPGAPEVCNGVDDNCNGQIDEGLTFTSFYTDSDGDGYGAGSAAAQSSCQATVPGKAPNNGDCNDANPAVHPGAIEVCNGVDDNCNGQIDEGLTFTNYWVDADRDGYGAAGTLPTSACSAPAGFVTNNTDCNDAVATIHPGAVELCNGIDDNCDGLIDNGVVTQNYYPDSDGDGYGAAGGTAQASCMSVAGKVPNNTDCNDANAAIHPGAAEVCNGLDDNCNGLVDEGLAFSNYFPDADSDGYGSSAGAAQSACAPVSGKVANNTDCNDANPAIHPGAAEVCNGLDDNCNGQIDEGLPTLNYYTDADLDGYGAASAVAQASCRAVAGKVTNNGDCNDAAAAIHPGALEVCNGLDDNCNGQIDEGNPGGGAACSTGQLGVCAAGVMTCAAGTLSCARTTAPSPEVCDGLDNDCNGSIDETWPTKGAACSVGLGVCARTGTNVCTADKAGLTCSATAGSPTAPACDGLDNDCDGIVDEPFLIGTNDLTTTAWQDLEVSTLYYGATCQGGTGTGTDTLIGGGLAMAVGQAGINFQKLTTTGAPSGAATSVSGLTYSDVAIAQAADGFVIAGVWAINNAEIDLYYVDGATGLQRTYLYTQFKTGNTLDSLRVVRGNGKRVVLVWREAGVGIRMARAEVCYDSVSASWSIKNAGCTAAPLTSTTIAPAVSAPPGVGADSAFQDWVASQPCGTPSYVRLLAISYFTTPTSLNYFTVYEDGSGKSVETVAHTVAAPKTMTEPDLTYFVDSVGGQFLVAYVSRDPGAATPQADLDYWLTSDPTWHYAYTAYGTQNGVNSILRPRTSATATNLWLSAILYQSDASAFKRQIMTRTTDLAGVRTPAGTAVELSATSGACGADPNCRPGDKYGFTNWAPFSRVYYAGSGSTPAGSYASVLTCN